jgi:hypothetical protein
MATSTETFTDVSTLPDTFRAPTVPPHCAVDGAVLKNASTPLFPIESEHPAGSVVDAPALKFSAEGAPPSTHEASAGIL